MSERGLIGGDGLLSVKQPRVTRAQLDEASKLLSAYRVMAVLTGVVLLSGTIELIVKYAADVNPPIYAALWIGHGWLFMIYVIVTALLGFRLHWPLPRYGLVMLAGTVPTMSFVAEHFVTRSSRAAADALPEPARD
ncbi:MAG: DUF3817 domain-containing protein [Jatrophihabitans sp.]